MSDDERDQLLQMLEAHGQQFLASFDYPALGSKRKENAQAGPSSLKKAKKQEEDATDSEANSEDEWSGFGGGDEDEEETEEGEDEEASEDGDVEEEGVSTFTTFVAIELLIRFIFPADVHPTLGRKPDVVQFNELGRGSSSKPAATDRALQKAFMVGKFTLIHKHIQTSHNLCTPQSSKVTKLTSEVKEQQRIRANEDEDDDLYVLLHLCEQHT